MILKNEDGTNIIEFGTGDIEVSNGFTDDPEDPKACVVFIQQKQGLLSLLKVTLRGTRVV